MNIFFTQGHSVFTIEETYKIDKLRSRHLPQDEKDQDSKSLGKFYFITKVDILYFENFLKINTIFLLH